MTKEIETYGLLKITSRGREYLSNSVSFLMSEDHKFDDISTANIIQNKSQGILDQRLMNMLVGLRKQVASENEVPPYAVFQEYSLKDMCLKYPITQEELININGVGEGKAKRYGDKFLSLIISYVEENKILRPDDLVVKSTGINSALNFSY